MKRFSFKLGMLIVLAFVLMFSFSCISLGLPATTNTQPAAASSQPATVIDVEINTLFAEVRNNPVRARQDYHDKTIRVTGKILSIHEIDGFSSLSGFIIGGNSSIDLLPVFLEARERSKLVNLNSGQEITVRGVFDISEISIYEGVIEP